MLSCALSAMVWIRICVIHSFMHSIFFLFITSLNCSFVNIFFSHEFLLFSVFFFYQSEKLQSSKFFKIHANLKFVHFIVLSSQNRCIGSHILSLIQSFPHLNKCIHAFNHSFSLLISFIRSVTLIQFIFYTQYIYTNTKILCLPVRV